VSHADQSNKFRANKLNKAAGAKEHSTSRLTELACNKKHRGAPINKNKCPQVTSEGAPTQPSNPMLKNVKLAVRGCHSSSPNLALRCAFSHCQFAC
jgi:hypothetical protein